MMECVKWPGPGREADALVAEKVMGACVHDFDTAKGDAYFLAEAREAFTEDYGEAPPPTWRPYDWEEEWRAECSKCGKRWDVYTGNCLRPRADQDARRYTKDYRGDRGHVCDWRAMAQSAHHTADNALRALTTEESTGRDG